MGHHQMEYPGVEHSNHRCLWIENMGLTIMTKQAILTMGDSDGIRAVGHQHENDTGGAGLPAGGILIAEPLPCLLGPAVEELF